jgi:UDP-N-acetylglucosamine 2-epimerase (non-hydrolysing)
MPPEPLRILVVYGTRPEVIKMAPVIAALRARPERFAVEVCATAQHRELLDQAQAIFGLAPDHDLDLMQPDQELNELTVRVVAALDRLLAARCPDWLLVQGDTTSAMASALAAFHRRLRIGHVEAGLRTGDLRRPFPEEANRRLIDQVADLLFAPTPGAAAALAAGGADRSRLLVTGNTVVDALVGIAAGLGPEAAADEVLVTVHRRESFGEPLAQILAAIADLAAAFPALRWVYPVHPNPNVSGPARRRLAGVANVELVAPLAYPELVRHLRRARLALTDSGGIQEEAPTFGTPVLVLRETTERPEGVAAGVARLVGVDREAIFAEASRVLSDPREHARMSQVANPYGDGRAAERIVAALAGEPVTPFAPV